MRRRSELVFVDTSAWRAFMDSSDQYYKQAVQSMKAFAQGKVRLVTSDYVFDETITGLRFHVGHEKAVEAGRLMLGSKSIWVADITPELRHDAWQLFSKFSDQEFSFTDCTSFALMRSLKIGRAFTFDHHFKIMRFGIEPEI